MDNNLIKAQKAFEANVIDEQTFGRIKEYNIRLSQNNVPVIYNLRHLRKNLHMLCFYKTPYPQSTSVLKLPYSVPL